MISHETLAVIIAGVLLVIGIAIVLLAIGLREWSRQHESRTSKDVELLSALQAVRRSLVTVSRKISQRDHDIAEGLKDAKELILHVEQRLRNEICENREYMRDGKTSVSNNFSPGHKTDISGGQNNIGHNDIRGDQVQ